MGKGAGWPSVQSVILLCCVFFLPVWSNPFLQESIIGVGGCSGVYALKTAVRNKENASPIFCCRQVCEVLEKKELPLEQVDHRKSSLARFQLRKGGIQERHVKGRGVYHFWGHNVRFRWLMMTEKRFVIGKKKTLFNPKWSRFRSSWAEWWWVTVEDYKV